MANEKNETVVYPFMNFHFSVEIHLNGSSESLCSAAFSECDGLEMNMGIKTIREGGNNGQQIHLAGPVTYGQLTLKRGMTTSFDLWDWFDTTVTAVRTRAQAEVVILSPNGLTRMTSFVLTNCIPIKLKAPALNATDGRVAIEELQLAYETLKRKR